MLGIFGTLNLATRSLSTQRIGTEVAGHNLANVNNTAYARQRVDIGTSLTVPTDLGSQGTGADVVAITQLRNVLLDYQIQAETSVRGSLESQQQGLQYAQANLGQEIDRQASGVAGAAATGGVGGQHGLAEALSAFFASLQSLSTKPTDSAERQVLIIKAQDLTTQFNQVAARLGEVEANLNSAIDSDVSTANGLIADIAKLNEQITAAEVGGAGKANDLRDIRQQKLEALSKLTSLTTTEQPSGAVDLTIGGVNVTAGAVVTDTLETYDAGGGRLLVRAATAGVTLPLTGGSIHGSITVRDGPIASLQSEIDQLASALIAEVNALHTAGQDLYGNTGQAFFTGTDAASIRVNTVLSNDPNRIQAAAAGGATGDNGTVLALAALARLRPAALGNQTFTEHYGRSVAALGQALASTNTQLDNQTIVEEMLVRQRDSISGVSLDEEMTDLVRFQRSFEASARLISTLDEMLATLVQLGR